MLKNQQAWKGVLILIHSTPVIASFFTGYFGVLAALGLVLVPYIKSKRLQIDMEFTKDESTRASTSKRLEFWKKFTFLP